MTLKDEKSPKRVVLGVPLRVSRRKQARKKSGSFLLTQEHPLANLI